MAIQPEQPIVVPAVPEKTYTEQWVYNLVVHAPTLTTGNVRIELLPGTRLVGAFVDVARGWAGPPPRRKR